ncbi:MAG: hypothetical protein JWR84_3769 [Caulobacter sp.]|nr:hypothetical protein [Caulobacter sp.]
MDPAVRAVIDAWPPPVRPGLLALRDMILETAAQTEGVGPLDESLKWGEPAYRPVRPRTGTTVRINALKGRTDGYAAYFHCQSGLIGQFRMLYPDDFTFEGERALIFQAGQAPPAEPLRHCIALALTHHLRGR